MNTQNPDPEEFARQVLWPLCGLRAELRLLLQMFSRQIEPDIQKADRIYLAWISEAQKIQRRLYQEAVDMARIPPREDQNSESNEV